MSQHGMQRIPVSLAYRLAFALCLLMATSALPASATPSACTASCSQWAPCDLDLTISSSQAISDQSFYALRPTVTVERLDSNGNTVETRTEDAFFYQRSNGSAGAFKARFNPSAPGNHRTTISNVSSPYSVTPGATFSCGATQALPGGGANQGFLRQDPSYPRSFLWDGGVHPYIWGQTYYQVVNQAHSANTGFWQPAITGSRAMG